MRGEILGRSSCMFCFGMKQLYNDYKNGICQKYFKYLKRDLVTFYLGK